MKSENKFKVLIIKYIDIKKTNGIKFKKNYLPVNFASFFSWIYRVVIKYMIKYPGFSCGKMIFLLPLFLSGPIIF